MKTRIGINGFGRIGRLVLRAVTQEGYENVEVGAINSFADPENNAHMFKYDTTYGTYKGDVSWTEDSIVIDGNSIACLNSEDPSQLPWAQENLLTQPRRLDIWKEAQRKSLFQLRQKMKISP